MLSEVKIILSEDRELYALFNQLRDDFKQEIKQRPSNSEKGRKITNLVNQDSTDFIIQAFEFATVLEPNDKGLIAIVYNKVQDLVLKPIADLVNEWENQDRYEPYVDRYDLLQLIWNTYHYSDIMDYYIQGKVITETELVEMIAKSLGTTPWVVSNSSTMFELHDVNSLDGVPLLIDYNGERTSRGGYILDCWVVDATGWHYQEFSLNDIEIDKIDVQHAIDMSDVIIDEDNPVQRNLFSLSFTKDSFETLGVMEDGDSIEWIAQLNFLSPNGREIYSEHDVGVSAKLVRVS